MIFFGSFKVRIEKSKKGFPIVFPKLDLADVGGNFHIWALKLGGTLYITTLKSPRKPARPLNNIKKYLTQLTIFQWLGDAVRITAEEWTEYSVQGASSVQCTLYTAHCLHPGNVTSVNTSRGKDMFLYVKKKCKANLHSMFENVQYSGRTGPIRLFL